MGQMEDATDKLKQAISKVHKESELKHSYQYPWSKHYVTNNSLVMQKGA
jgi:hypothetical protein